MKRLIMAILLAVFGGLALSLVSTPSQAAAISIPSSDIRTHTAQDLVEQVRHYRHCWWRGGHRYCAWYYAPGYHPGYGRCHRWHRICRYRWGYSWRYHRCMHKRGC